MKLANWVVGRVFANGLGEQGSIPGWVIPKTQKMVLDAACLTLSTIRYMSRVKWSNPGKGVVFSPTSIEKGIFRSPLTMVANFTYLHQSLLFANLRETGLLGSGNRGKSGYTLFMEKPVSWEWRSGKCGVTLLCHYSQIHSDPIVVPVRVQSMSQIDLFKNYLY